MNGMTVDLPGLRTAHLGQCHRHFEELDSTNNYLKEHAGELCHGASVTASYQTAGKGRLGRSWAGERNSYLALSLLLHNQPPEQLPLLPLVAGLAVSTALERLCGVPFPIKWSNDVLCHRPGGSLGKLCGILCEGRTSANRAFSVVGIGVNLLQTEEEFSRHALVYAGSLFLATGKKYELFPIAAEILNKMEPLWENLRQNGFAGYLREEYRRRCATLGQEVRLLEGDREETGTALDIDEQGALLCHIGGRIRAVRAGEVSVRGLYGYS